MIPRPQPSTLFPYTTLFRSCCHESHVWLEGRREKSVQTALAGLAVGAISTTPVRTLSSFAILRRLDPKTVPRPPATKTVLSSEDRKSTRLNSSHSQISYAVF